MRTPMDVAAAGLLCAAITGLIGTPALCQVTFFVSPTGSDSANGTITQPFLTLTRARDAIRYYRATTDAGPTSFTVNVRAGTYNASDGGPAYLNNLVLSAQDSGDDAQHLMTYQAYNGEPVLIHGGKRILNWVQGGTINGLTWWGSTVPWITPGGPDEFSPPVDLYVNNRRMTRARFPNATLSPTAPVLDNSSFAEVLTANGTGTQFTVNKVFPAPNPSYLGYAHSGVLQMVARREWVAFRQYISAATPGAGMTTVTTLNPLGIPSTPGNNCYVWTIRGPQTSGPQSTWRPGDAVYFEGAIEFMNSAYEWYYLPTTAQVWIILPEQPNPPTGENNPNQLAQIVAPRSTRLLTTSGASHLRFNHLDFAFTNFPMPAPEGTGNTCNPTPPATGWFPRGGGYAYHGTGVSQYPLPGAVQIDNGDNCVLAYCRIAHTGASGLAIRGGASNVAYSNEIFDTGGAGLYLGRIGVWGGNHSGFPVNGSIRDNYIHDFGVVYHDAVGLKIDWVSTATVFYNEVENGPYSGIHIGLFGEISGGSTNVYSSWNRVRSAMQLLRDGGAFHTVGYAQGSSIHDNAIYDVYEDPWYSQHPPYGPVSGRRGLMMDINGTGYVVDNNVVFNAFGIELPYVDGNCCFLSNFYHPTSYWDELGRYCTSSPPQACCSDPNPCSTGASGIVLTPNSTVIANLATTPAQPMAAIRDSAGPRSPFYQFVHAIDPLVHPF